VGVGEIRSLFIAMNYIRFRARVYIITPICLQVHALMSIGCRFVLHRGDLEE
jgi:hypothetical protein